MATKNGKGGGKKPPKKDSNIFKGFEDDFLDEEEGLFDGEICSFCGASSTDGIELVGGPLAAICADCVQKCMDIINESRGLPTSKTKLEEGKNRAVKTAHLKVPAPRAIKEFLDQYIIGQEQTKKDLAVAVHNHYRRITDGKVNEEFKDVELDKSNVLLIGPTGSGKTLFARTLARMLDVPFAIADATTLTEAGYVGDDVENILLRLIQAADMNIERAEFGIIYIDEIDKIGRRTENVSITRDVSGEGVQQALLKILEGTESHVPPHGGRKHPNAETIKINTHNILFILGGAFVGLDSIIKQRQGRKVVGYVDSEKKSKSNVVTIDSVQPEDLVRFGLIPEFVGRVPVISTLDDLTEDDLVRILTEPKNCIIRQYQKLLDMEGVKLSFDEEALREAVRIAIKRKTGARGLRAVLERLMLDVMYNAADNKGKKVVVTVDDVKGINK